MKKVLIITYYWPPSGGSGVQRWLKMAKYLPEFGYEPVVYTPESPTFGIKDQSLAADETRGIKVLRKPIWDPGSFFNRSSKKMKVGEVNTKKASLVYKLIVWLRGNMFIPDSKIFWVRPSLRFLGRYCRQQKIDLIVTTGPPHSMHMIGYGLKKMLGIKWVADFRDPWSEGDIIAQVKTTKFALKQHQKMESNVLTAADRVVAVGKRLAESLQILEPASKMAVVANGYDEDDFTEELPAKDNKKFTLTYSGLLYNNRNPYLLWQVLDELCCEDQVFADSLQVNIAGVVADDVKESLAAHKHLYAHINFVGYLSHPKSIELCRMANMLILTVDNTPNSRMLITGKLFEYLATELPIIGFGLPDSDANDILVSAGHHPLIDYDNKAKIREQVIDAFKSFKTSSTLPTYKYQQYSRRNLAGEMSKIFNDITAQ